MNEQAVQQTEATGKVTFYSRSKKGCGQKEKRAAIF